MRRYNVYDAPKETWIAIVKLAHQWQFSEVKHMASRYLNQLQDFDPVDKIELFRTYDLDRSMLGPSYFALVARPEDLTLDECLRLKMDTTRRVFIARARALQDGAEDLPSLRSIVADVFELELSAMQPAGTQVRSCTGISDIVNSVLLTVTETGQPS